MITTSRLLALCPAARTDIVSEVAPRLERLREKYGLTSPLRIAHFLAQVAHESGGFAHIVENLSYSARRIPQVFPRLAARAEELAHNPEKFGNVAYANKIGNGDEASGDGFRYRGRGLIQLTGRANYRNAGAKLGIDLEAEPDKAAHPLYASELALLYWAKAGCNEAADQDDIAAVTRKINGPKMQGLAHRSVLTDKAKRIFT